MTKHTNPTTAARPATTKRMIQRSEELLVEPDSARVAALATGWENDRVFDEGNGAVALIDEGVEEESGESFPSVEESSVA